MSFSVDLNVELFPYQRGLSIAQAIPIVGPIVISPIKIIASIAQIVTGVVGSIFLALAALVTQKTSIKERAFGSICVAGLSFIPLMYAASNILSLGIIGLTVEWLVDRN